MRFRTLCLSGLLALGAQAQVKTLHPGFDLIPIRPTTLQPDVSGMDFLPDGSLAICTWGGQRDQLTTPSHNGKLYILKGVTGDAASVTVTTAATGLEEPLGLKVVNGDIYMSERENLNKWTQSGGTWTKTAKIADAPGGATRSEWFYGLEYKDGFFYANFALGFADGGAILTPQPHKNRGTTAKIALAGGAIEYLAGGFRTHDGITLDPRGEIYVTDNQGEWMPSCKFTHVVQGRQYGVKPIAAPFDQAKYTPPTAWIPYNRVSKSSAQPIYIKDGLYAGQFFVTDVVAGGLSRVFVETVNGEEQGAVIMHSQGLEAGSHRLVWGPDGALYLGGIGTGDWKQSGKLNYGLQKLKLNGKIIHEILAVRARKGGMEIQFTKEVGASASLPASYEVKIWQDVPNSTYGGGRESNSATLAVKSVQVSPDKKSVFLAIDGLKETYITYLHLLNVPAADGEKPWSSEAFYTLNSFGTTDPFTPGVAVRAPSAPLAAWQAVAGGRGLLRVRAPGEGAYSVKVYDHAGALLAKAEGRDGETLVRLPATASGACLVRFASGAASQSRLVVLP